MQVALTQLIALTIVLGIMYGFMWYAIAHNKKLLQKRAHRSRMKGKLTLIQGGRKDP